MNQECPYSRLPIAGGVPWQRSGKRLRKNQLAVKERASLIRCSKLSRLLDETQEAATSQGDKAYKKSGSVAAPESSRRHVARRMSWTAPLARSTARRRSHN